MVAIGGQMSGGVTKARALQVVGDKGRVLVEMGRNPSGSGGEVLTFNSRGDVLVLLATSLAFSAEAEKSPRVEAKRDGRAPIRDQRRTFRTHVKSWLDIRRSNVVMQQRDYSCGAAALASVMQFHLQDKSATELSLL